MKDKIVKPNLSGLRREPIASKIGGIAKKLDMSKNRAGFINPGAMAEDLRLVAKVKPVSKLNS